MANAARMVDIKQVIADGGSVRFVWGICPSTLIHPSGVEWPIDGRAYSGFLKTLAPKLCRHETGSLEKKDLVIEWRKR